MNRLTPFIILILVAAGLLVSVAKPVNQSVSTRSTPTATLPMTVSYKGVTGKTALTLLTESHKVQTKHYDFGDLVTGIDGQNADTTHYWIFYVDGKMSDTGASDFQTKDTQTIEWKLEAAH